MAFFTPATSLEARSASDKTTAAAAAAAAERIVKKLLSPNIVVVGCVNEDTTVEVERLPTPGETVLGKEIRRSFGGKGANQAVQAALLLPCRRRATGAEADEGHQQPAKGRRESEQLEEEEEARATGGGGAAAAVKKVAAATGKVAQKAKAAGEGVAAAVEGLVSHVASSTTGSSSSTAEEAQGVAEGNEELLREKLPAGGKVALICKLGDDEAGVRYRKYLAERGVEQDGVFTAIKGKPTGQAFITVSSQEGGENTIAYVPGANEHLTQSDIQQPHIVRLLQQARVVVCENGVDGSVTVEALRLAKAAPEDILTIFIPSPVAGVPREAFAYADYVVVNAIEAAQLYEQLVPLLRVRDSAGNVFEEQQQEAGKRQREREWPSLHATVAEKPAKAGRGRGGGGGRASAAEAAAAGATGKVPSALALRERLKAVGSHAAEILSAARPAEALMYAAAAAGGRVAASVAEREAAAAVESARAAAARQASDANKARETEAAVPATAADLSEAAAARAKEGGKEKRSVPRSEGEEEKRAASAAEKLPPPRRGKCDVIITAGSHGCTVTDRTEVLHISPQRLVPQHEIVDTVGAGDAFVGALAYFLGHEKRELRDAVQKAGTVASYCIQRKGASASYVDRATLGQDFFM